MCLIVHKEGRSRPSELESEKKARLDGREGGKERGREGEGEGGRGEGEAGE